MRRRKTKFPTVYPTIYLPNENFEYSYPLNIEQRLVEATVSQKGLAERISSYLVGSRADKTTIKYKSTLNRFQRFCCERGYIYLPANPIHVTVYLSDLLDQRVSYGVIAAAFYAIKWVHNINNYHDPTENGFVKSLLDAAKDCVIQ